MPGLWKPGHSLVNTKVPMVCHGGLEFRDLGDQHHWGHHPLQLQLDPTLPTSVRGWGPHAKLEESRGKEHIPKTMPLERWDALRCEGIVEHMCLSSSSKTGCLSSLLAYWQLYYRSYRPLALMQKVQGWHGSNIRSFRISLSEFVHLSLARTSVTRSVHSQSDSLGMIWGVGNQLGEQCHERVYRIVEG